MLVLIGRIGRPHGLDGELNLDGCSLDADQLLALGTIGWRGRSGETRPLRIQNARGVHGRVLITFAEALDRDAARTLTLGHLWIESDRLPDPGPDTAYVFQLVGLEVKTEDGRSLGTLADVLPTGAHPIYIVRGARELLIPATADVILKTDLTARVMTVRLPAGLEDL